MPDMFEDGARMLSGAHEVAAITVSAAEQIYTEYWRLGRAISEVQFFVMVAGLGQEPPPQKR